MPFPKRGLGAAFLTALFFACSGSTPPANGPLTTGQPGADASPTPTNDAAAASTDADIDAGSESLDLRNDSPAWRSIKYTPTSQGLEIELDGGVQLVVSATAKRVGAGWGVAVKLLARSDRRPQTFSTRRGGPMAFRGVVERRGKASPLDDGHDGEESTREETTTFARQPVEFSQTWPSESGEKPLEQNDTLTLHVGLWGVTGMTSRTPIAWKELFVVRVGSVEAGGKAPLVVVEKPERVK